MPRDSDAARRRLRQSALELFQERGYDSTTAAEIAARAGVTERTFFRHFPDKREVLFDGEATFLAALSDGVANAPKELDAMAVLFSAFRSVAPLLREDGPISTPQHALIARTPPLKERQLAKAASLVDGLAAALRGRGIERERATLAAQLGMAAFGHAARAWANHPASAFETHLERAFDELRRLV